MPFILHIQTVSCTPHGLYDLGISRVVLDLLSQTANMYIYCTVIPDVFIDG